ncbi:hypothetical protein PISMIDRAFT_690578 [Pisolithus microcarpus 441]|uniref:Uncharacterized protein n=1 Tax=Pisolithus microcarpus 441 TaxID=765257 RepID=A0A0C9XFP0_9AGAM|nr:hypothetical protein PISMIDRAFT_690578 [Pisolithus microcarpus 441]
MLSWPLLRRPMNASVRWKVRWLLDKFKAAWKSLSGPSCDHSTIAELVVFLRGLWFEGSVKIKWGRGSVHLEGARAEGIGAPDEGGAGED